MENNSTEAKLNIKQRAKQLAILFLTFFKIGLFTFGGGYAMIALLEKEFIERKKWLEHDEFMDIIAIAESTPGPIAINSATYIGYKMGGYLGAFFSTLAVCIPSFTIIFVISLFFNRFLEIKLVGYAFRGIQACVVYLILSAGLKMLKKLKKSVLNIILLVATIGCLIAFSLFAINFSTIFYILIGAVVGLSVYLITYIKQRQQAKCATPITESEQSAEQPAEQAAENTVQNEAQNNDTGDGVQ